MPCRPKNGPPGILVIPLIELVVYTSRSLRYRRRAPSKSEMCPNSGETTDETPNWRQETLSGGSLRRVDLHNGTNGWATPPPDLFALRSRNYFTRRQKLPSDACLLKPAGVDWLRSPSRLDHFLSRPDNRVSSALRRAQPLKTFLIAVNLQVPGREYHSAVFYFAADDPIPPSSLLYRFIHGDDNFRNSRFKMVNRIVKGPWIVKAAVGNYAACLLGRALTCNYHLGDNYLEIDVDISSSAIAKAILHLALGYVTAVTIDMGFLVEAQAEDELPERLFGAVRVAQMEMSTATYVDGGVGKGATVGATRNGISMVNRLFSKSRSSSRLGGRNEQEKEG